MSEMIFTCHVTDYSDVCQLQVDIMSPLLLLVPMFVMSYLYYLAHKLVREGIFE